MIAIPAVSGELLALLRGEIPGFDGPLTVTPLTGGRSNPTYLVEASDRRYVLRTRPFGSVLPSAHRIDREVRVLRALAGTAVPVPRVLLHIEDERHLGVPFYVMSHVQGLASEDPRLPDLSPMARARAYLDAIDVLAALHRVEPLTRGLDDFGSAGDHNARQLRRWSGQVLQMGNVPPALMQLEEALSRVLPSQRSSTIVHGDYRFGNLIVAPDDGRINAVIDWELSTLGDPFADLAYFLMAFDLPQNGQMLPGLVGVDLHAAGLPEAGALAAHYCRGMCTTLPTAWPAYRAMALFRSAAIAHGVFSRGVGLRGPTPANMSLIAHLADIGLRILT